MGYHKDDDFFTEGEDWCFYCHHKIPTRAPRIWWMGTGESGESSNIWFHTACSFAFLLRFSHDVLLAERDGEKGPPI